jgi:hypothetical protein
VPGIQQYFDRASENSEFSISVAMNLQDQPPHEPLRWRTATTDDSHTLGALNKELFQDEGHRNPMTLSELVEPMRGWIDSAEYQAVLFE